MGSVIFAVDPGSKECGFALVNGEGARVRFLASGDFGNTRSSFRQAYARAEEAANDVIDYVAVERPQGFIHDPFRGPTMLATSYVAGGIAWFAPTLGAEVVEVSASQGRKLVLGSAQPRVAVGRAKKGDVDRMVKAALPGLVLGMPPKTNVHVRDALLLAVAANWILASRKGRVA